MSCSTGPTRGFRSTRRVHTTFCGSGDQQNQLLFRTPCKSHGYRTSTVSDRGKRLPRLPRPPCRRVEGGCKTTNSTLQCGRSIKRSNPMATTVYCIHSITGLEATFSTLIRELIPGDVKVHHISDESLIRRILAHGKMTKDVRRRFFENVTAAEQAGADVIQVTCSSL